MKMSDKRVISENVNIDFEEQNPRIIKENLQREQEEREKKESSNK